MAKNSPLTVSLETFRQNAHDVRARLEGGESIDPAELGAALGLDPAFVQAALAVQTAILAGRPIVIVPPGLPETRIN